ncbi:hypothetical protein [Sphingomonas mucosissima]|uniref:Oligosaccharide repeat unit polymerase n=1 Tax=Sphingomonas mucosissima TaxID=370959 RepID=A0A245ZH73_9SPHN|nr:hypothetical protein [Sphingomonas mucosissima]OWK29105.1 hypothetical protein SPMU_26320 [Sphingomonas mucosissima]
MGSLGWPYLLALVLLACAQLFLGASLWVLSVLLFIAAAALVPLTRHNWRVSDALYAIMTVYFGSGALLVKTLAGQPVHTNLDVPDLSAGYLLLGFCSITLGYVLSHAVRGSSRAAEQLRAMTSHAPNLVRFAVPTFLAGAVFLFLQTQFRPIAVQGGFEPGGFGGFGTFYPLLPLGTAMQAALVAGHPRERRHRLVLGIMMLIVLALTLADNTKRTLFDCLFVIALVFLVHGARVRLRWVIPAVVSAAFLLALVMPAVQIVRTMADVRSTARIGATWQVMRDAGFDPVRLTAEADRIATGHQLAWRDSYIFPLAWNTERFTMIQPIDLVARGLDEYGTMGGADLWRDPAETLLPGFLIDKTLANAPDRIAWHYGFRTNGSIARPVVGLIASSLAAFGLAGVLLLPMLATSLSFLALDLLGGRLAGNVWGAFLLSATTFLAEKEVSTTLSFFCRSFPFLLLVATALLLIGSVRRPRPVRVIPINGMPL